MMYMTSQVLSAEDDPAGDVGLAGGVDRDGQVGLDDLAVLVERADRVDRGVGRRLDGGQQEPGEGLRAVGGGVVVGGVLARRGDLPERDAS